MSNFGMVIAVASISSPPSFYLLICLDFLFCTFLICSMGIYWLHLMPTMPQKPKFHFMTLPFLFKPLHQASSQSSQEPLQNLSTFQISSIHLFSYTWPKSLKAQSQVTVVDCYLKGMLRGTVKHNQGHPCSHVNLGLMLMVAITANMSSSGVLVSIQVLVWCQVKEGLLGDLSLRNHLCQHRAERSGAERSLASMLPVRCSQKREGSVGDRSSLWPHHLRSPVHGPGTPACHPSLCTEAPL